MKHFFVILLLVFLASCNNDKDFSLSKDCKLIKIVRNNQDSLIIDFGEYVIYSPNRNFLGDTNKILALKNTLSDLSYMGDSPFDNSDSFEYKICQFDINANLLKTLYINKVTGGNTVVIKKDKGKTYLANIPGLDYNFVENFSVEPSYWQKSKIYEVVPTNVDYLHIENIKNTSQSFTIVSRPEGFLVFDKDNNIQNVSQKSVEHYLDGLSSYYAVSFDENIKLQDSLLRYVVEQRDKSGNLQTLKVYQKLKSDGKVDFNEFNFQTSSYQGIAKYFDFDLFVINLDDLKKM